MGGIGCNLTEATREATSKVAIPNKSLVIPGAIRWDAWYFNSPNTVSQQAQAVLSPSQYQARAPWFSSVSHSGISSVGTQANMDSEIGFAAAAKLQFWAFNEYVAGSNPDLRTGWSLYQASTLKSKINWTWISDIGNLGSTGSFASQVAAYVTNFKDPQYQTVLGGRPLWFLNWNASNFAGSWGSSYSNLAAMITSLRAATVAAGLKTPYIVVMDVTAAGASTEMTGIGADAISHYNSSNYGTYAQLVAVTEAKWASYAATGKPFIPTAVVGWDLRPFITTPEPWYNTGTETITQFTADGTVQQVAQHIQDGAVYVGGNPSIAQSGVLLVYAWDECAEGGANMLIPTLGHPPPSSLLAAVGSVFA